MRYEIGIVSSVALVLGACSSGQGGGRSSAAETPTLADQQNEIVSFDYLGPLWEQTTEIGQPFPKLSACPGSDSKFPFTSCIETVTLDGNPADATDLKAGRVVEIHGARFTWVYGGDPPLRGPDNPTVTIDIQRAIVGPIEAIDVDHARLTVLGQSVYANDTVVASHAIGDMITVYGHFSATGQIVAELVEPFAGDPLFLVRGVLTELAAGQFAIGKLEVDIAGATRDNFPGGAPISGDTVLLLGDQPPVGGVLTATTVRCIGACLSARWESGSLRGFLTGWRSPTDFEIDGIALRPSSCECAISPPPALGSFVAVRITDGNAEIVPASSTSLTIGVAGRVTASDPVAGEIAVLGYRVQVTPATHITASAAADFEALAFDELKLGDAVEISGQAIGAGIRADAIVRQGTKNIVKALDYTLVEPAIAVAGRTIVTESATEVWTCERDSSMTVEEFFARGSSELSTWLLIDVNAYTEPLIANEIVVCPPGYQEPGFDYYW